MNFMNRNVYCIHPKLNHRLFWLFCYTYAGLLRQLDCVFSTILPPKSLQACSEPTIVGNLYKAVCFDSSGKLIVSCNQQITYDGDSKMDFNEIVLSLAAAKSSVYILLKSGAILSTTEPYTSYTPLLKVVNVTRISARDKYLCVLSKSSSADLIYTFDFASKTLRTYVLDERGFVSLSHSPDGAILVLNQKNKSLHKYKLEEESQKLELVWSCDGLEGAYSVCTDKNELIYVAGSGRKVHVLLYGKS